MRIFGLAAAAAVVLAGCPSYDARVVVPESTKEVNKQAAGGKPKPVDILFVVDNSASMADEQEKLATNFRAFIEVLSQNRENDYRLAVVTTDLDTDPNQAEFSGLVSSSYGPAPYYTPNPSANDRAGCMTIPDIQHGCFRGPAGRRIIESTAEPEQQIAQFAENVRVGSCGSGAERGLQAMTNAFTEQCNAGFLRAGANLVIVIVTDEEDEWSDPNNDYLQQLITNSGKSPSQIRLALIVGSVDGRASYCGKDGTANCGMTVNSLGPPSDMSQRSLWNVYMDGRWCSYFNAPDCCPARPGQRYIDFALRFEDAVRGADPSIDNVDCRGDSTKRVACLIDSICQNDFSGTLRRIARDLVISNTYSLEPPAKYIPGVVVEINGTRLRNCEAAAMNAECDFNVTPDGATVTLKTAPKEDDKVEIYFIVNE